MPEDQERIAGFVRNGILRQRWIVSYDNEPAIREMYSGAPHIVYDIGYSARSASLGPEVMFFCDALKVSSVVGPVNLTEDYTRRTA